MKRILVLLAMITILMPLFAVPAFAGQVSVTLAWDLNDPEPVPGGYAVYRRAEGEAYDYSHDASNQGFVGMVNHGTNTITTTFDAPDGAATRYYFVARAILCDGDNSIQAPCPPHISSGDSNEVEYMVDLTIPNASATLAASYDDQGDVINLSWQGDADPAIKYWKVYTGDSQDGPWTPFGDDVPNSGAQLTSSGAIQVAAGERKEVFFTIVAFKTAQVFSPNSNVVSVVIDKRLAPPTIQLRIEVVTVE